MATRPTYVWNGTQWEPIGDGSGSAQGGGTNSVFVLNDTTVTEDYTIPVGKNAMSAGPITIVDGVTVLVTPGSAWVVV